MIEGWQHDPETTTRWEEWRRLINDKDVMVLRVYRATPWPPHGGFDESGLEEGYEVKVSWKSIATLPITLSVEDALALAIAHVRLA